jgi:hypothetical protein
VIITGAVVGWKVFTSKPDASVSAPESTTPKIAADAIVLAVRTGGWKPGKLDTADYDDVRRTSFRAIKDRQAVMLTIYECHTDSLALALEDDAKAPDEAVRFGRTVVKVSATNPLPTQKMVELLRTFREILIRDGHL